MKKQAKQHHCTECGLNNIFMNGFKITKSYHQNCNRVEFREVKDAWQVVA